MALFHQPADDLQHLRYFFGCVGGDIGFLYVQRAHILENLLANFSASSRWRYTQLVGPVDYLIFDIGHILDIGYLISTIDQITADSIENDELHGVPEMVIRHRVSRRRHTSLPYRCRV